MSIKLMLEGHYSLPSFSPKVQQQIIVEPTGQQTMNEKIGGSVGTKTK